MKTVMGWIDKIVSSLARRKVNKNEGRPNSADRPPFTVPEIAHFGRG